MLLVTSISLLATPTYARATIDAPKAKLRSIDKVTARTMTFDVDTGSTIKFGSLYIKLQACRKAPDIEEPESAAFMQIWEVENEGTQDEKPDWVFSGWMFSSSPGLSAMDHPIYDVWVLECTGPNDSAKAREQNVEQAKEGEGVVEDKQAPIEMESLLQP
ncbi:MAG: DUF2155 domain-containing protein [Bdellovibrionales bacterium]